MDTIDNLKKLFLKDNWRYLVLVIWLLVGVGLLQFQSTRLIGMLSFLPFTAFLMYLLIFSLIAKKDIKEVATWKVLLIFFLSLPVLLLLAIGLLVVFIFSIFSYFFFTSWFILYGAFLSSRRLDNNLKEKKNKKFFRSLEFFGCLALSVFLCVGYILYSEEIGEFLGEKIVSVIHISNYVVLFVLIVIGIFTLFVIGYLFKKVFAAWLGVWFVFLTIYTFYLLIKIFLAFRSTGGAETSSPLTQTILLIADFAIILYSVATLMGTQAEMLVKRLNRKRIGLDTVVLWLVFSKVAYEFAENLPISDFTDVIQWIPLLEQIADHWADWVNFTRNLLVLVFFLLTLLIIGFYEFSKYFKDQEKLGEKIEELVSPRAVIEDLTPTEEEEIEVKQEVIPVSDEQFQGFVYVKPEVQEEKLEELETQLDVTPEVGEEPKEEVPEPEDEGDEDLEKESSESDVNENDESYSSY